MNIDWGEFWDEFDARADALEYEFQDEMVARFGEGHYFLSDDERWERQKKVIQALVTKEFTQ
jgi:hypothetical protein